MSKAIVVGGTLIALLVAATAGYLALNAGSQTASAANDSSPAGQLIAQIQTSADGLGTQAANDMINASGVKSQIENELYANAEKISVATGLSETQVDQAINDLDVEDWQACALPADAEASSVYPVSSDYFDGTITTYADPTYITLTSVGQSVTLSVPESAQDYIGYLSYL